MSASSIQNLGPTYFPLPTESLPSTKNVELSGHIVESEGRDIAVQRIAEAEAKQIKLLNLSHLGLKSLPAEIGELTHLEVLILNGNHLQNIEALGNLPHLRSLSLDNNRITDISSLRNLKKLLSLSIENNLVEDISTLQLLPQLRRCSLGGNRIIDISPLGGLNELQVLSLCGNNIKNIRTISGLMQLLNLDVSRTAIEEIPESFAQLSNGSIVSATETLLSREKAAAFENEIRKVQSENPNLGPQFVSPFKADDLISPYDMIATEFPQKSPPLIARATHYTSNFLGSKISTLLGQLGARVEEIDLNFLDLDPCALIEEVHAGIQQIRRNQNANASVPIQLLNLAQGQDFPSIQKIQKVAEQAMSRCDGLALPGGPDIEQEFYNEKADLQPSDYRRSIAEFALVSEANRQKKPIIGICRGAQLINIAFGGTLKNVDRQIDWQTIELTDSSKKEMFEKLFQDTPLSAYFYHHQACDRIAPGFHVVMHRDKIPEMIVSENDQIIGIQVHPEQDEKGKYSKTIRVFKLFLENTII